MKYWRDTISGLIDLALDAAEVPIVWVGEKALAWWDRKNPDAHDIDDWRRDDWWNIG